MAFRKSAFSLRTVAKRLALVLMGAMVLFSFFHSPALANSITSRTESASSQLVALAASSRFAAQQEVAGQEMPIPDSKLQEMREKRREWQSEASAAANTDDEDQSGNAVENVVKNRLNLDEITEENEIVDQIKNP